MAKERLLNPMYFLTIGLTLFSHALSWDGLYKFFQVACLFAAMVLAYRGFQWFDRQTLRQALAIVLYPSGLIIITILAGISPANKTTLQLCFYTSIPLGLLFASAQRRISAQDVQQACQLAMLLIVGYAAVELLVTFLPAGIAPKLRNPHYRAQYSLLLLFPGIFLFARLQRESWQRLPLALSMLCLCVLLMHTSSRPAWLALVLSGGLFLFLGRHRFGWRISVVAVALALAVYALNVLWVRDSVNDLVLNLTEEERVTIWRNALSLQMDSSTWQWLFGHGIGSFLEDFKPYSEFRSNQAIDFATPHNHLIEVVYSTGLTGLIASAALLALLYRRLYREYRRSDRSLYIATLITILTANLLFTSITVSFFRSYNLLIIAVIAGLLIAHENTHATDHGRHS